VPSVVFNVTTRRLLMTTPTLSSDHTKPQTNQTPDGDPEEGELWPGIDSRFRLIVVAALRAKQLLRGANPRIDADPLKRRNTSIALEEVRRGLVPFTVGEED
jgi:DNA-directed RNA polymerase subunit omega